MTQAGSDIALARAIIAIDHSACQLTVLTAPDDERQRDKYAHAFGACDPYWSELSDEARRGELLMQIWHAVTLLGIKPPAAHEALVVIPEYRDLMPAESIPKRFRK